MKKIINKINNNAGIVAWTLFTMFTLFAYTLTFGFKVAVLMTIAVGIILSGTIGLCHGWVKLSKWAKED